MSGFLTELLIITLLLVVNGAFAMAELAVVAARKARLRQLADSGDAKARAALELALNPTRFLATVQIGITLVGILAGAFGGATIAEEIGASLARFPPLAPYGEAIGVAVVVIVITFFSLVIGELVPKRLALHSAERIAAAVAVPMRVISSLATPAVWLLNASTELVIRLLRLRPSTEPSITAEEIRLLIEDGAASGVFESSEQTMIDRVLRLGDRRAEAFMVPYNRIVWLDVEDSPWNIQRKVAASKYSRYPVGRKSLDELLGFVRASDLLSQVLGDQSLDLASVLRAPLFVPEHLSALQVLELFKKNGTHLALIVDEYGAIQGMVTLGAILEDLSGHAGAAGAAGKPRVTPQADGSWILDGMLHLEEAKRLFKSGRFPEGNSLYQSVGGFVTAELGRIPSVGQSFHWEGLRFEVLSMDGRRVEKVLVAPRSDHSPEPS